MQNTHSKGESGERVAEKFLTEKDFRLIERNYRYERGEIDLIFDDHGILVFVEVKTRSSDAYGEPEDSITPRKRRQIRKVAEAYLWEKNIKDTECRFDVVAIKRDGMKETINYYKNAF
jgi:putative endonuclease